MLVWHKCASAAVKVSTSLVPFSCGDISLACFVSLSLSHIHFGLLLQVTARLAYHSIEEPDSALHTQSVSLVFLYTS